MTAEASKLKIDYLLEETPENNPYISAQSALNKSNQFDAIITVNDLYAAEIIKEAKRRNLKIPDDFQLVGYDNNILCGYTSPTISTIDQNPKLIGQTAAHRLLDLMSGNNSTRNSIIDVLPIKRDSTL